MLLRFRQWNTQVNTQPKQTKRLLQANERQTDAFPKQNINEDCDVQLLSRPDQEGNAYLWGPDQLVHQVWPKHHQGAIENHQKPLLSRQVAAGVKREGQFRQCQLPIGIQELDLLHQRWDWPRITWTLLRKCTLWDFQDVYYVKRYI